MCLSDGESILQEMKAIMNISLPQKRERKNLLKEISVSDT